MKLTQAEEELIQAIRNLRNTKHNFSTDLEWYTRELFEKLLEEDPSN